MTLPELIPIVKSLSQANKVLLLNLVTSELTQEMGLIQPESEVLLNPGNGLHDSYEAAALMAQFLADNQSSTPYTSCRAVAAISWV
jgi:hypothetical protein